jgi:cytochrome c553
MSLSQKICIFTLATIAFSTGALAASAPAWPEPTKDGLEFFEREVRPILVNACYGCHSADAEKVKGDLLLDTWEGISKGGSNGPTIVPGKPDDSSFIHGVRWDDKDFQMPPKDKLSDTVRIILERWVAMGAPYPRTEATAAKKGAKAAYQMMEIGEAKKKWQFQAVKPVTVPKVKNTAWSQHPLDLFMMAKWETKGIVPAPVADKRALIRRATFDLTGLPPTPQEVAAFLADNDPKAFERVTDRLLASPAYGERWGRHWLDLVRYADTGGDSADYPVPDAYKYRDYVIDALNADKPYDRFLKEQLAGDLLPATDPAEKRANVVATGYIALSRRFGVQPVMNLTIDDTIDNVGKTFLGLTVACARCHDHKFDPISTKDYYALWGIFGSTKYPFPGSENVKRPSDFVPLVSMAEVEKARAPFKDDLAKIDEGMKQVEEERKASSKKKSDAVGQPKSSNDFRRMIADLEKQRAKILDKMPKLDMAFAVAEAKPKDEWVHVRGDQFKKGEVVPRRFLTVLGGQTLPPEESAKTSGRLQLAEWIADPKNPLTARVLVNRVWQWHFGKGLVATPNDWGKQGKAPTHPELIDYLAGVFAKNGYSIKAMHRLIMSSKTYQLSCDENPASAKADGVNDLQWHFARQRLSAEQIRDAILAVSGELDRSRPGAHPFPPQDKWTFTQHAQFSAVYDHNHRSVYLMQQRIKKHPFLGLFDGADTNACTGERPVSTTPLQALFFMNDPFLKAQGEKFAQRLMKEQPNTEGRVTLAYWLTYGRPPSAEEMSDTQTFLRQYVDKSKAADANAEPAALGQTAYAALGRVLLSSNEFLFTE